MGVLAWPQVLPAGLGDRPGHSPLWLNVKWDKLGREAACERQAWQRDLVHPSLHT